MNKIVTSAAKYIIPRLLEKPLNDLQQKHEQNDKEFLESSGPKSSFIIARNITAWIEHYYVMNQNNENLYTIKKSFNPFKNTLYVFDKHKNKVGIINLKLFNFINFISPLKKVYKKNIVINDIKIGSLFTYTNGIISTYRLNFNNWKIETTKLGLNKTVKNIDQIIIETFYKFSLSDSQYYINIYDKENEFLCLMIAIALNSNRL